MSETTEFKDVYEAIASVSPNRQNILYTVLEEDAFGKKRSFQMINWSGKAQRWVLLPEPGRSWKTP